ncbi:MAG: hypothetical protein M1352_00185 [Patescibacteria group bacterium]|nr:hypothetical protein [Patescibacteria group bacterium]
MPEPEVVSPKPANLNSNPATPNAGKKEGRHVLNYFMAVLALIIVIAGIYFYLQNKPITKLSIQPNPVKEDSNAVSQTSTPTPTPVTAANVDQTLNNTEASIQKALDQTDADLKALNSIDKTQDSTVGL